MKRTFMAIAVFLLAVPTARGADCSPTTFLRARQFPSGPNPFLLVSGDFDHDGLPDIAVTDSTGISVLLNDGSGGFLPPVHTELGASPQSLVAGAFDAGNDLDLAVTRDYGTVEILLGNGDGTFTAGDSYVIDYGLANLLTADFDHDGTPDLALTSEYGGRLVVLLGQGNGTFGAPVVSPLATQALSMAAADFDGDDFPDVALALNGGVVSVSPGLGNGRFGSPIQIKVGGSLGPILAADLNGLGAQDIVVGSDTNVAVIRGNGDGTFQAAIESPLGYPASALAVARIDGDTFPDIAAMRMTSAPSGGAVSVLRRGLDGFFEDGGSYEVGPGSSGLAAADFNGDGLADLATANYGAQTISVLSSFGDGNLEATLRVPLGGNLGALAVADFVGDSRADIATLQFAFPNVPTISVLTIDESGRFVALGSTAVPGNPSSMAAGRFVPGSYGDLVVSDFNNGFSVLLGRGDGNFAAPVGYAQGIPMSLIAVADFNGDGISDVIAVESQNPYPTGSIAVFLGAGDGTFTPGPTAPLLYQPSSLLAVDVDLDGRMDVVTSNGYYANSISVYRGTRVGFLDPEQFPAGPQPVSVAAGAFTGLHQNLVVADAGAATVALLFGIGSPTLIGVGSVPTLVVTGDFNGDGRLDFATASNSGSNVSVLLGNGDYTFQSPQIYPVEPSPYFLAGGPLRGALPDLVVGGNSAGPALDVLANSAVSGSIVAPQPTLVYNPLSIGVLASGYGPVTYQWFQNGLPLVDDAKFSGTTTSVLHINLVSFPDTAEAYSVAIMDSCTEAVVAAPPLEVEFADVPPSNIFFSDIVTIAKAAVTAGCGGSNYCPSGLVSRAQMAVFLLKSEHGAAYAPPPCTGLFADVPCPSPYADWIEQLATEGVTAGCGGGDYCPDASVTRAQMAVFLLRTVEGSGYVPPPPTAIFADVPVDAFAAAYIDDLYNQGIAGGCSASPLLYCPGNPVNRGQMAAFLVNAFPGL